MRLAILFILFVCFNIHSTHAADLFTVDGIEVSSSGENAKQAKEIALLKGQKEAFQQLIARVASKRPPDNVINTDPTIIANMVQGVEIYDEKITANYYSATLNISFNPSFIEKILQDSGIEFNDTKSAPIVIIPVFMDNQGNIEIEDSNPWRNGLQDSARSSHILNVTVLRSLRSVDKSGITANIEDISPNTIDELLKIGRSYDANRVIIAMAAKDISDEDKLNIRLRDLMEHNGTIREFFFKPEKQISEDGTEEQKPSEEQVFSGAAKAVVSVLEGEWIQTRNDNNAPVSSLAITVPIYSLEQWFALKKRLDQLAFLKEVKVKAVTIDYAFIEISFRESFANLIARMRENGFYFENTGANIILRVMGQ